jgi:hypothetical protein
MESSIVEVANHVQSWEALDTETLEDLLTTKVGGTHVRVRLGSSWKRGESGFGK